MVQTPSPSIKFAAHWYWNPLDMTQVSNDPSWWPLIDFVRVLSYVTVASTIVVLYDWALTFGQEFELVWRQRWSLMTVLYLSVRYVGILYSVINMLAYLPSVSWTDNGCTILDFVINLTVLIVNAMLGVIMITRLHAMYQRSRKMLVFLVVIFSAVMIASGVMSGIGLHRLYAEELVLSGTHVCVDGGINQLLVDETWILFTVWEVLALSLAIWIAVKHFRDLQRQSTRSTVADCFTVLIRIHLFYFAAYAAVACFNLGFLSPNILNSNSVGVQVYWGAYQIASLVQQFVLGPRLILSVRQYNAKLVAKSDEGTAMTTIVFQEQVHESTGGDV